jgi:hypothetical protein
VNDVWPIDYISFSFQALCNIIYLDPSMYLP